jgi:hypothetical protein
MPALAIWTPEDGLLGALAPLGLAAAAGTCLVVDLDPAGPHYPGARSLASLVAEGPRREDLSAARRGVAVVRNGGVDPAAATPVLDALVEGWERVVLRLPPRHPPIPSCPVVPVRLSLPGTLFPPGDGPSVYQATPGALRPPGPGIRLPVPNRRTVEGLISGRLPLPGDRWIRAWRRAWEVPWGR